jgi:GT2 family glycosyltransferase
MVTRPSYALVLTHNRPELLLECVLAISLQVDHILIIDNASDPPTRGYNLPNNTFIMRVETQPPNIAQMWNLGFDTIARDHVVHTPNDPYDIAVLCDDAIVASDWFKIVSDGMREHGAAIGCTRSHNEIESPMMKFSPDRDMVHRMTPWAYVIAGEIQLRADERMHIWWQDTDLDWQARHAGGMVVLPGPVVANRVPNEVFANNSDRAILDGDAFAMKWGKKPW